VERRAAQLETELNHSVARVQQMQQDLETAKATERAAQEHTAKLQKHVADVEFALADSYQELTRGNDLIGQLQEQNSRLTAMINEMSTGAIRVWRGVGWGWGSLHWCRSPYRR
jgi:septal ring factor EnvC (AmiA/AmiB activator)